MDEANEDQTAEAVVGVVAEASGVVEPRLALPNFFWFCAIVMYDG